MTTERELQEWKWRRNKKTHSHATHSRRRRRSNQTHSHSRKRRNTFQDKLLIVIGIASLLLFLRHGTQFFDFLKGPTIQKITDSSRVIETKRDNSAKPSSFPVGQSLSHYDYSTLDHLAASLNYDGTSVRELANQLKAYGKTDLEKARLIYSWIAHHIAYDYAAFLSRSYREMTPQALLRTRKGVCSGYALLFQALAQEMGLEAHVIEGYSKGIGYAVGDLTQVNHAWNAIKINNAWYLIDSTWGAGVIKNNQFVQEFNSFYFATNPSQFIYSHLPRDPDWQLLSQPYSKQQFDALPQISSVFFKYGLKVNNQTHPIQGTHKAEILLDVPDDIVIASKLSADGVPLDGNYTLVQKGQNKTGVYVVFPSAGTYELTIFAKPKGEAGSYHQAIVYRLIARGSGQEFPKVYRSFSDNKAYLKTPLTQTLPAYQSVHFKLVVPQAQEVQVISQGGTSWTPLLRSGNFFEGTVSLETGPIIVVAKFPNQSSYQYLLEYEAR